MVCLLLCHLARHNLYGAGGRLRPHQLTRLISFLPISATLSWCHRGMLIHTSLQSALSLTTVSFFRSDDDSGPGPASGVGGSLGPCRRGCGDVGIPDQNERAVLEAGCECDGWVTVTAASCLSAVSESSCFGDRAVAV